VYPPIIMNVKITFDTGFELTVNLLDTEFVCRWTKLLATEIEQNSLLQDDTYSCFINQEQAQQKLKEAITTINDFLKTKFISLPTSLDFANPEFYNELHVQFERLAGPDWDNPTRLMVIAPEHVKIAVRHINRYCHRLELQPYKIEPLMRVEFNTVRRKLLEPADYELFNDYYSDTDIVLLDYSTLGKSLFECYQDNLTPDYPGLKIQRHYSANFVLKFGNSTYLRPVEGYRSWLTEYNVIDLPKSAFGSIKLGEIVEKNSLQSVQKTAKILNIRLE